MIVVPNIPWLIERVIKSEREALLACNKKLPAIYLYGKKYIGIVQLNGTCVYWGQ